MEEVVGSIPTRSTNSLSKLDRASAHTVGVCIVGCVVTRRCLLEGLPGKRDGGLSQLALFGVLEHGA